MPCRRPPPREADTRGRAPSDQPETTALCCQLIETVTDLRIYGNPQMRFSGFVESRRTAPSETAAAHAICRPLGEAARRELAHEQARVYQLGPSVHP